MRTSLFRVKGRRFWVVEWKDPITGRLRRKSTGETSKDRAERVRGRIELDIENGLAGCNETLWADAWAAYQAEEWPRLRPGTRAKASTMRRHCEAAFNPSKLSAIGAQHAAKLAADLRRSGASEHTVNCNVGLLRRFLRWCVRRQLLAREPQIRVVAKLPARGKGRPVTGEEFERMLASVAQVVGEDRAEPWRHFLRGLWLSGLRLAEALALHWTDSAELLADFSAKRPMFRIQAATDKTGQYRVFPMAPDFAAWLGNAGRGYVFRPTLERGGRPTMDQASKIICEIGKAARVVVQEYQRAGKASQKFASAHDLRRAFGTRWSLLVRPPILMAMMRHADIQTTMKYYVCHDAAAAADEIWRATDTFTDTDGFGSLDGEEHRGSTR